MSIHYSKFELNTYCGTPYFDAHIPADYPLHLVMQKCRSFRKLPPRLRELSTLAKKWSTRTCGMSAHELSQGLYSDDGYELDPNTGTHLTDKEINAEWDNYNPPDIDVQDIPLPDGGFPDPDTWEVPPPSPELCDRSEVTPDGILSTIATFGRPRAAATFGVPSSWLPGIHTDEEMVEAIMGMHDKPWPARETQD